MALKQLTVRLMGFSQLILHNGLMANPLHPFAKQMKKLTSKRSKTDEDLALIADVEWLACWYYEDGKCDFVTDNNSVLVGDYGRLIMPGYVLESMLVNAAKKNKLGMQFKSGVFVDGDGELLITPEKSLTDMLADQNFRIVTLERVQQARVTRCRPYLKQWGVVFTISYEDTIVDKAQIEQALDVGGKIVGLCERRPRHGRFTFEVVKNGSK